MGNGGWSPRSAQLEFVRRRFFCIETRAFGNVAEIWARQVDAVTYFENILDFKFNDDGMISIGETDYGLETLEATLRWFGVEGDWYSQLEAGGPGTELCLFRKTAHP